MKGILDFRSGTTFFELRWHRLNSLDEEVSSEALVQEVGRFGLSRRTILHAPGIFGVLATLEK